jgi:hypothetical protein
MLDALKTIKRFVDEPIPSFFFGAFFMDASPADGIMGAAQKATALLSQLDPTAGAFTEITGLTVGIEEDSKFDGGSNFNITLPKNLKTEKLTLKRYLRPRHVGVMGFSADPLTGWCQETMQTYKSWTKQLKLKHVLIIVYHPQIKNPLPIGPSAFPIAGFIAEEAYPVSWDISDLGSTSEEPIQETITLAYKRMYRLSVPPA